MKEISNNLLAALVVFAVIILIIGFWTSMDRINNLAKVTGRGTSGYVNVTIANMTNINVTATDCNFGSGTVNASSTYAIIASNGTSIFWNGTGTDQNMSLRNDGNQNVTVNVSAGKDATGFLGGGTGIEYKMFAGVKDSADSCTGTISIYPGTTMSTTSVIVCQNMSSPDALDEIWVGCYLKIADNTPGGSKTDTWTFSATAI